MQDCREKFSSKGKHEGFDSLKAHMTNYEAFKLGMKYAAMLVRNHWNDSHTTVIQRDQAIRSAAAIEDHSEYLTEKNFETITEDKNK